jgi:hypothetical protein
LGDVEPLFGLLGGAAGVLGLEGEFAGVFIGEFVGALIEPSAGGIVLVITMSNLWRNSSSVPLKMLASTFPGRP